MTDKFLKQRSAISLARRAAGGMTALTLVLFAGAAYAQTGGQTAGASSQDSSSAGTGLAEIVVTAQKRSTVADKTPISITALTGADIAARGSTSFADLAAGTPGVSIKSMGPGQTEFEMRGMTSSGGNSPTVGFYLDDIPLTSPAAAQNGKVVIDPTLYDLNQVEVLRGPQGTLYGSSSMGGTIKMVTNKPQLGKWDASFEVVGSGTDGGGLNNAENAMVNVPIGNTMALRAVVSQSNNEGWINREVIGNFPVATNGGTTRGDVLSGPVNNQASHSNADNKFSARVSLKWKPADDLTVLPSFMYQRTHADGPSAFDSNPGTLTHYQPFNIAEPYTDTIKIAGLSINWHTSLADVTSATSYWDRSSSMVQDNSENLPSVGGGFGITTNSASYYGANGTGPISVTEIDPSKQFSEELRAASNGSGPIKWLVGAYYADFHSNWNLYENVPNPASFGSPTDQIFTVLQPTHISQEALFGEATWSPSEKLHITAGLRGYHYQTNIDTSSAGYGEPSGNATPVYLSVVQKNSGVNPKLDISYNVDQNTMLYATAARGFRPGGGNQPLPSSSNPTSGFPYTMYTALTGLGYANGVAPTSYGPDHLWSYEAGEKAKFFHRHLRLNTSFYYEDWSSIQLEQLPAGYPLYNNINSAHIYGGETELEVLIGPFNVGASMGYTHATLAFTQNGFSAGQRLPDVPYWSGGSNISWKHDLDAQHQLIVRLDQTFVGERVTLASYQGLVNNTNAPLPSYNIFNLRATIKAKAGWSLALFADNLTNEHAYVEYLAQLGLPNASYNRVVTNEPRTIGLDLNIHL